MKWNPSLSETACPFRVGQTVYYIRPREVPFEFEQWSLVMAGVDIGKILNIEEQPWDGRRYTVALVKWYMSGRVWTPVQFLRHPHEVLADATEAECTAYA